MLLSPSFNSIYKILHCIKKIPTLHHTALGDRENECMCTQTCGVTTLLSFLPSICLSFCRSLYLSYLSLSPSILSYNIKYCFTLAVSNHFFLSVLYCHCALCIFLYRLFPFNSVDFLPFSICFIPFSPCHCINHFNSILCIFFLILQFLIFLFLLFVFCVFICI